MRLDYGREVGGCEDEVKGVSGWTDLQHAERIVVGALVVGALVRNTLDGEHVHHKTEEVLLQWKAEAAWIRRI